MQFLFDYSVKIDAIHLIIKSKKIIINSKHIAVTSVTIILRKDEEKKAINTETVIS